VISEKSKNLLIINVAASDIQPKFSFINFINFIQTYYEYIILTDLVQTNDRSVGIATGYMLDGWGSIPGGSRDFSPFHSVQTGSGALPASYPMGTGGTLSGNKAAEA
jgi:hypothetical protein